MNSLNCRIPVSHIELPSLSEGGANQHWSIHYCCFRDIAATLPQTTVDFDNLFMGFGIGIRM
jgi:hypothetical protein